MSPKWVAEAMDEFAARVAELQSRIREAPPDELEAIAAEVGTALQGATDDLDTAVADLVARDDELRRRNSALDLERAHYRDLFDAAPIGYLVTDAGGAIVEANSVAGELLFGDAEVFLPKPLLLFVDRGSHLAFLRLVRAARATTLTLQAELLMRPFRRDPIPALVAVAPIHGPAGGVTGLRWLLADITDFADRRDEMRARVAELEEVDDAKDAFLLGVAHDLRAPVAAIAGLARTSLGMIPEDLPSPIASILHSIAGHADALQRMENDLLDLERVGRGVVRPYRRMTDVADLVSDVVKHVELGDRVVEVTTTPVVASVDPGLIRSLLQKLVDNAARHTPEGSSVWVTLEDHPETESFLIVVEDDGTGVEAGLRDRVFELFQRGDPQPRPIGVGAGLYLVRKFAGLHRGTARLVERPGGGARFEVSIPTGGTVSTQ